MNNLFALRFAGRKLERSFRFEQYRLTRIEGNEGERRSQLTGLGQRSHNHTFCRLLLLGIGFLV